MRRRRTSEKRKNEKQNEKLIKRLSYLHSCDNSSASSTKHIEAFSDCRECVHWLVFVTPYQVGISYNFCVRRLFFLHLLSLSLALFVFSSFRFCVTNWPATTIGRARSPAHQLEIILFTVRSALASHRLHFLSFSVLFFFSGSKSISLFYLSLSSPYLLDAFLPCCITPGNDNEVNLVEAEEKREKKNNK